MLPIQYLVVLRVFLLEAFLYGHLLPFVIKISLDEGTPAQGFDAAFGRQDAEFARGKLAKVLKCKLASAELAGRAQQAFLLELRIRPQSILGAPLDPGVPAVPGRPRAQHAAQHLVRVRTPLLGRMHSELKPRLQHRIGEPAPAVAALRARALDVVHTPLDFRQEFFGFKYALPLFHLRSLLKVFLALLVENEVAEILHFALQRRRHLDRTRQHALGGWPSRSFLFTWLREAIWPARASLADLAVRVRLRRHAEALRVGLPAVDNLAQVNLLWRGRAPWLHLLRWLPDPEHSWSSELALVRLLPHVHERWRTPLPSERGLALLVPRRLERRGMLRPIVNELVKVEGLVRHFVKVVFQELEAAVAEYLRFVPGCGITVGATAVDDGRQFEEGGFLAIDELAAYQVRDRDRLHLAHNASAAAEGRRLHMR